MTMTMGTHTGHGTVRGELQRDTGRKTAGWLLLAYLVPIAVLVLSIRLTDVGLPLLADAVVDGVTDLRLIPGLRFGHVEALANIVIFLPIGFLLTGLLGRRSPVRPRVSGLHSAGLWDWAVWLVATAMSAGIELTQMFLLTERSATVRDLMCNSAGALTGILIYRAVHVFRNRARRIDLP